MKILIPMAGMGKRFNDFLSIKPLIELDGKPMIAHVIDYFPKNAEFIFICNEKHFLSSDMKNILSKLAPHGRIVPISDEMLKGPAYSSVAAFPFIDDDEEVIVNYCDFIQMWDFERFMREVREKKPDGAIISFKGFHPSSLGETYYAYMKVDSEGFISQIKEKESFSEDRMKDFGSTGTYYFANGKTFKRYVKELISEPKNAVKGEFYMSLPFILMIRDGFKIMNYEAEKFICLGTPRDYELYKFWSEYFVNSAKKNITFDNINTKVTSIFPLAGGERDFKEAGFSHLNFMIPVMNRSLIHHSLNSYPKGQRNIFLLLREHKDEFNISHLPDKFRYNSEFIYLKEKTQGNAATLLEAKDEISPDEPVCVSGCTYMLNYDEPRLKHLMENEDIDVILFSFSHHEFVLRNPDNFHYARVKDLVFVEEVVAKKRISDSPYEDAALTGTAIYRRSEDLFTSIKDFVKQKKEKHPYFLSAVNTLIEKGKKVVLFDVDKHIPMRTVTDYMEFRYWEDYFDKRSNHPYSKLL